MRLSASADLYVVLNLALMDLGPQSLTEKVAGEVAQSDARLPGACFERFDYIGPDRDFVMAVSQLSDHSHGPKSLRVIHCVVRVPKLRCLLVAGEPFREGINRRQVSLQS